MRTENIKGRKYDRYGGNDITHPSRQSPKHTWNTRKIQPITLMNNKHLLYLFVLSINRTTNEKYGRCVLGPLPTCSQMEVQRTRGAGCRTSCPSCDLSQNL